MNQPVTGDKVFIEIAESILMLKDLGNDMLFNKNVPKRYGKRIAEIMTRLETARADGILEKYEAKY